jgi:hypothetical protein
MRFSEPVWPFYHVSDDPRPFAVLYGELNRVVACLPHSGESLVSGRANRYNESLISQSLWRFHPESQPRKRVDTKMRSTMKEIYRASPMRTMPIHFYHLEPGRFNQPTLMQFKAASFQDVTPGTARQQVERRFRELVAGDPDCPRVVVIAPTIGDPPGEIIAVELIGKSTRELVWLAEPSTGIA